MTDPELARRVEAARHFNRFYTQKIGVLREGLHDSPFPLTEARVLYELAHRERPTAAELSRDLGLDPGYLSRILRGFQKRGLLTRRASPADRRQSLIELTDAGRTAFAPLDQHSRAENGALLASLDEGEQRRLIAAMTTIETLLGAPRDAKASYLLRPHRPGDMGWVISAHGRLYAEEYGWDISFEALVADIAAKFIREFDARREACWIAERDGEPVGSVFVVRASDEVAKLRLLIVDPKGRGLGIGRRLVEECLAFARRVGYRRMTLWTNANLLAARHIYVQTGFRMTESAPHRSFGQDLIGETWERDL
jgi:DNA-binding MarR family transcriptional regulator/GNAT superfamily N-acetyltransferase